MATDEPRKHTLLITANLETDDATLAPFLTESEVIRGIPFKLSLTIDNTGPERFPGGRIAAMRIAAGALSHVFSIDEHEEKYEVGELGPSESTDLELDYIEPIDEGVGWIHVKIGASDGQAVEYQQNRDAAATDREWSTPFFIVNRELLRLSALLKDL